VRVVCSRGLSLPAAFIRDDVMYRASSIWTAFGLSLVSPRLVMCGTLMAYYLSIGCGGIMFYHCAFMYQIQQPVGSAVQHLKQPWSSGTSAATTTAPTAVSTAMSPLALVAAPATALPTPAVAAAARTVVPTAAAAQYTTAAAHSSSDAPLPLPTTTASYTTDVRQQLS
jgi:hypothetical protein